MRGEKNRTCQCQIAEDGKYLLPLKCHLVGNDGILNDGGPEDDVVKSSAAAGEVMLKAVNVPLVDGAMDSQVIPIKDGYGDWQ